ncbi:TPA: hypothetical protein RJR39_004960 [Burkholderia cenocepacia]|nr:hypothetical protein [Burkholderia cenocepacia]HDV6353857.1 hypothetical protein [Burkholderia cenocepacia]
MHFELTAGGRVDSYHPITDPPIHRSTDPPIHRSTDPPIHRSTTVIASPQKKKAPEGAFNMLRLVRQAD